MEPAAVAHRERLLPRWWVWLVLAAVVTMLAVAYGAALGGQVGWLVAAIGAAAVFGLVWITAPLIRADADGLHAGAALLPPASIGDVCVVSADRIRELRGPGADGRLFVALRPWAARSGVLVHVDDPDDPHPAWLVSSRHPERLVAALTATMGP